MSLLSFRWVSSGLVEYMTIASEKSPVYHTTGCNRILSGEFKFILYRYIITVDQRFTIYFILGTFFYVHFYRGIPTLFQ